MSYLPIEDYALIGNMHTAALVGRNGSIDWLCWPTFDAPSVFGRILDDQKGGFFQIEPVHEVRTRRQMYWPETNVLITRFMAADGVAEVVDFMPVGLDPDEHGYHHLIRHVEVIRGEMPLRVTCEPAFNYARDEHKTHVNRHGAVFEAPDETIGLATSVSLKRTKDGVTSTFELERGDRVTFALHPLDDGQPCCAPFSPADEQELLDRTLDYWHRWLRQCTYDGRWREEIYRSALVLKLLTYEPTGAIIAAPTTSLPESIGGVRNWDYRYTWIRDAAFTVYAFLRLGFTEEAKDFIQWLEARSHDRDNDTLQIVYGIDGTKNLTERTLDHLDGYCGSRPVRIGNAAADQLQLDIYGELMDAAYLSNKYSEPISHDLWTELRDLINWVCDNWQRKDEGIWEVRSGRRHFVFSKLMCWVALDRGLRLADKRSFPADRQRWLECRDAIYQDIMDKGWSERRQAFVQHYESDALDASNLIMPLVFFMAPSDPRMIKTLESILRPPSEGGLVSDSLVYRYDTEAVDDGLPGYEGTFNMCTFWMVEALTRAGRTDREKLHRARLKFEKMLGYANHVGLYAEQTGPCGEALGNFPQALTHLALISAAYNLDQTLDEEGIG